MWGHWERCLVDQAAFLISLLPFILSIPYRLRMLLPDGADRSLRREVEVSANAPDRATIEVVSEGRKDDVAIVVGNPPPPPDYEPSHPPEHHSDTASTALPEASTKHESDRGGGTPTLLGVFGVGLLAGILVKRRSV
jgi:hypothetical protein